MFNYNINKKGKIDSDALLVSFYVFFILVISIVVSIHCYNNYIIKPSQKSIIAVYNNIIIQFRKDSYLASKVEIASGTLTFFDNSLNILSKYELDGNRIVRLDKTNKKTTIFEDIESYSFNTNKDLPNLVTVRIYPADKKEIPFFTSFALRGCCNGK